MHCKKRLRPLHGSKSIPSEYAWMIRAPSKTNKTSLVSQRFTKACDVTDVGSAVDTRSTRKTSLKQSLAMEAEPTGSPAEPPPVVSLSSETIQDKIRFILSGTTDEAKEAIEAIYATSRDKLSMELFITNSGVAPLIRHACRDSDLSESSQSVKLLFRLFLDHHQVDIADKIIAVARTKSVPLEQKNALRILLAFVYVFPLPGIHPVKVEITNATKELLIKQLRNLWSGLSNEVEHALDCISFIALTPQYHEALVRLMEQDLPANPPPLTRASTYLTVAHEPSSATSSDSRLSSWSKLRRRSSKFLGAGFDMLKDIVASKPTGRQDGVRGLVEIATKGTITEREMVTAILAEFATNDASTEVQSMCRSFCKGLVSKLGCTETADINKIQAITCIEHLCHLEIMRRHFLETGLSPELYLLAQLGADGPRHHAERLLGQLLDKPDVQEFFKPHE